jgi:RimJ/RimL family protein N-acetyltransferase
MLPARCVASLRRSTECPPQAWAEWSLFTSDVAAGVTEHRDVERDSQSRRIYTRRLLLRPWQLDDEIDAFAIYSAPRVARWLCPALPAIADGTNMRRVLMSWMAESDATGVPLGRWAITNERATRVIGGVALLPLPPGRTDLEIAWQVAPAMWGQGYGAEAGHAVAHQAFEIAGVSEVFAVVRPGNHRGVATARRVGMEWVGETDKYYGLSLQVYRLTKADLDLPEPGCAAVS